MNIRKTLLNFYFVKLDYMKSRNRRLPEEDALYAMLLPLVFFLALVLVVVYIKTGWGMAYNYGFILLCFFGLYLLAKFVFRKDHKYRLAYDRYQSLPPGEKRTLCYFSYGLDILSLIGTLFLIMVIKNYML